MDDAREALTEIDRLLADALDVDVPPDFPTRVRRQIAATDSQPAARWGWRVAWPAAAAAAVLIAVTILAVRLNRDAAPPLTPLAAPSLAVEPMRSANETPGSNIAAPATHTGAIPVRALSPSAAARTEPEILVPREEIAMYRRLMTQAQLVPQAVVVETPPDIVPPGPITDLAIEPIKIDPIMPPPDGGERDRQR